MLQHQPHCSFPNFRGITFVSVHYSILSRNGVSGKSGAVHFATIGLALFAVFAVSPVSGDVAAGSSFRDTLRSGGQGPEMLVIPAGSFRMGCVSGSDCDDEEPVHEVVIARPFAMSKYEVTFEDYDRFPHPDEVKDAGWGRGQRPVIHISWEEATAYAAWLSTETGKRYRLPTEAEWEYAVRAGSATKYHFGDNEAQLCRYGNHADTSTDYEFRNTACSDGVGEGTAEVGQYQPNAFGLYDMQGNVYEWVQDCWNNSYAGAPADGRAWTSGDCGLRVVRGGAWGFGPTLMRSASRHGLPRWGGASYLGFRLIQDL